MTTKTKAASRPAVAPSAVRKAQAGSSTTPLTMEECVYRIATLGERIDGYIRFMSQIATLPGTSAEAKERVVAVFYEQMVRVERELGRIHEDFQLE